MAGAGGIGSRIIARMEGRRYYLEAHLNQVSASNIAATWDLLSPFSEKANRLYNNIVIIL
jgi:hypothetical protein